MKFFLWFLFSILLRGGFVLVIGSGIAKAFGLSLPVACCLVSVVDYEMLRAVKSATKAAK